MGLGALVVGYRRDDPRRLSALAQGVESISLGKRCISCGADVYFVRSGVDAYRTRDPHVICDQCYQQHKPQLQSEL